MEIQKKIIPHKYRNKYLRNSGMGGAVSSSVYYANSNLTLKLIVSDEESEITDTNVFTSKRVIKEIETAISEYDSDLVTKLKAFIKENKAEIIELLKDEDGI